MNNLKSWHSLRCIAKEFLIKTWRTKESKEIHSQQYSKKTKKGYAFWVWRLPERTMIKNDYMENHEEIKEESLAGNR